MCATKRSIGCVLTVAVVFGFAGCDSSSSKSSGPSMDQMAGAVDAQKETKKQEADAAAAKAAADQKAAADAAATPSQPEMKKVGDRAHPETGNYYGAIIGARRHAMNVADNLAWIQGVRSFKAEEGRKPKDNNEFMKVVVTKYELQLPKIEPDEEYFYDPKGETDGDFGQLYVVKKGETPSPGTAPAPGGTPPAK
jgi:hypothetical protein